MLSTDSPISVKSKWWAMASSCQMSFPLTVKLVSLAYFTVTASGAVPYLLWGSWYKFLVTLRASCRFLSNPFKLTLLAPLSRKVLRGC